MALKAWQHTLNQPLLRISILPQQLLLLRPCSSSWLGVCCLSTLLLLLVWQGDSSTVSVSPSPCSSCGAACGCFWLRGSWLLLLLLFLLPEPPLVPACIDVPHEAVHA
jgi:hypothetical protein